MTVDLRGLGREHVERVVRFPLWASAIGLVLVLGNVWAAIERGSTGSLVLHGVFAVGIVVSAVVLRRGGDRVTLLEPERVGTGTRTWRGALEPTWTPWSQVERVAVPGPWGDDARVVVRGGAQLTLPGLSRDDARRLAQGLRAAQDGHEGTSTRPDAAGPQDR